MQIQVEETRKIRRASACMRDGGVIHVKVPRHWSRDLKRSVIEELVERLQKKDRQEKALLSKQATKQEKITLATQAELETFVRRINAETFNVELGKIQIGYARYNHLAQVNLRTKTMTVSKYCLKDAPAEALRYLIIHELAHYFESGHGPKFWALVGRHVPDYRLQSRIMKAFHHQTVIGSEAPSAVPAEETTPIAATSAGKSGFATKPKRKAASSVNNSSTKEPKQNKTGGLIPGFVKQLLLWGDR
ncbi:MAG: hypothetical protein K0Q50_975 [Vampirovibrio sp.]|jgi:predicted metal-dependent hydrolase|nr:hypothetical protein [Vampirovibrio sp.]